MVRYRVVASRHEVGVGAAVRRAVQLDAARRTPRAGAAPGRTLARLSTTTRRPRCGLGGCRVHRALLRPVWARVQCPVGRRRSPGRETADGVPDCLEWWGGGGGVPPSWLAYGISRDAEPVGSSPYAPHCSRPGTAVQPWGTVPDYPAGRPVADQMRWRRLGDHAPLRGRSPKEDLVSTPPEVWQGAHSAPSPGTCGGIPGAGARSPSRVWLLLLAPGRLSRGALRNGRQQTDLCSARSWPQGSNLRPNKEE